MQRAKSTDFVERESSLFCKIKQVINKVSKISLIKTIYINMHYFGIKGVLLFPILVGKQVEFKKLNGKIILKNFETAIIQIGINEVGIIPNTTPSIIHNKGTIIFEGKTILGRGTCISNSGKLIFGKNFSITGMSTIICKNSVSIGNNCVISWNCQIMDSDLHNIYDKNSNELLNPNKNIEIGNNNWLCSDVTINKGVIIKDNNIIASGSTINKSIYTEFSIIGNRGHIIKENIVWET